ncbi:MAG: thiamine diphosphokinase [Ignavibacteriales bacterium]|nr:thiamine diphosphokinase [Ignavibacteriales bacterium]
MNALIIANGILPSKKTINNLKRAADIIICADGGANGARKNALKPDIILGDFDSITPATKKYFVNVPQILIENQNSTDLEKAICFCIVKKIPSVAIIGVIGDRIDHSTGSLGCFKKFGHLIEITIVDTVGVLTQIHKYVKLKTKKGEKISLIPLERCTGVTTKNLKYNLNNDALELGVREGISNEATSSPVSISVKKGTLLLYRFHSTT